MPKSNFVDFRAVKRGVSMVQVLEHYGLMSQMHRSGDSITGACPIHGRQNKTAFRVSISKNRRNCLSSCGCAGNVLDFVSKKEKVSKPLEGNCARPTVASGILDIDLDTAFNLYLAGESSAISVVNGRPPAGSSSIIIASAIRRDRSASFENPGYNANAPSRSARSNRGTENGIGCNQTIHLEPPDFDSSDLAATAPFRFFSANAVVSDKSRAGLYQKAERCRMAAASCMPRRACAARFRPTEVVGTPWFTQRSLIGLSLHAKRR